MHGLVFLYRSTGWNHHFTNLGLKEFGLESSIHYYATTSIRYLLEILMSSNYLNFQTVTGSD